jgi:5'-deoxynucleotidase YfbR-like HD superfamily hydrolase
MTTPTMNAPGVQRLDTPCWTIVDADGEPAGFEGSCPHFRIRGEADEAAAGFDKENPVTVVQENVLCWVAYLNCGEQFIYEGDDYEAHFADQTTVLDRLSSAGLPATGTDGVYACDAEFCRHCAPWQGRAKLTNISNAMLAAGELALRFGRVERATFHPDGIRPETDTDHTVMLGLVACSLARSYFPQLDVGVIAQIAFVHDLPEAEPGVGDVNTLRELTDQEKQEKTDRETRGAQRIYQQFQGVFPWLAHNVWGYKGSDVAEARFVRVVDWMLPKLTHILNRGATPRAAGMTRRQVAARYEKQLVQVRHLARDFPFLIELYSELVRRELAVLDGAE